MTLIPIGVPTVILNASGTTGPKEVFALPIRATHIGVQTVFSSTPAAVQNDIEVSLDEAGPFVSLTSLVNTAGEFETLSDPLTAAMFIRVNQVVNTGAGPVTVTILCKAE